jgi:hypothetical protein
MQWLPSNASPGGSALAVGLKHEGAAVGHEQAGPLHPVLLHDLCATALDRVTAPCP